MATARTSAPPTTNGGRPPSTRSNGRSAAAAPAIEQAPPAVDPELLDDLRAVTSRRGLETLLSQRQIDVDRALSLVRYEQQLERLQIELVRLQQSVQSANRRVAILFEGRDAAGKGGTIRRFTEHLNPRSIRVVALPKPTDQQQGQWYLQRYVEQLPNPGEIVFFDRSWYNRAVVEPVNGFCTPAQYATFMQQVPEFEHMLYEDGIELVKFWFSIARHEQAERFEARRSNPLKQWKLSPVDHRAQELWDQYTQYKEAMFSRTHTSYAPWTIVAANDKRKARINAMRYVLSALRYEGKDEVGSLIHPDPRYVMRFHRGSQRID